MEKDESDISPCPKCYCMTHSIRKGRAKYICGKCGADKSLSDVYFYEFANKKSSRFASIKNKLEEVKK